MSVINKPKKLRTKALLIMLRGIEKSLLENADRENTIYSTVIAQLRDVESQVLTVDEGSWSPQQIDVWDKFEDIEDAFKADPTETAVEDLSEALQEALNEL